MVSLGGPQVPLNFIFQFQNETRSGGTMGFGVWFAKFDFAFVIFTFFQTKSTLETYSIAAQISTDQISISK